MVSVLQVYNALKDLANKEQKGFITPQVFNSFAALAQMNIYNEMFSELIAAKKLGRQSLDPGRDKSLRKQKLEDLSYYIRRMPITIEDSDEFTSITINSPADLSRIISLVADSVLNEDVTKIVNCELIYDPEKINYLTTSNLSSPTEDFPVALVYGKKIEIFPDTIASAELTYYAKPTSFDFDGFASLGSPFYDFEVIAFDGNDIDLPTSSCRDFMLPPHYLTEVVMEIAKLLGVRLRDPNVTTFAAQEEASE